MVIRHWVSAICVPALLLGLAGKVGAVDGVIQINQARALAGGVTAGDLPGFPVQITEPGSYILTSNLDVTGESNPASVTAITVTASGAMIDLNGFGIVGPTVCSSPPVICAPTGTGVGILFTGSLGHVEGGAISGMGHRGIDMSSSDVGVVRRVSVYNSGENGIVLPEASIAEEINASANGGVGIHLEGGGRVAESQAFNNGGTGIEVGDGSRVRDSIASGNGGSGISMGGAASAEKCITNVNGDAGITGTVGGIVRSSVASGNTTDGIRMGTRAMLTHNDSYGNTGDGIEAGTHSTVVGNMVSGNIGSGLNIAGGTGYQGNVVNVNASGTVVSSDGNPVVEMGGNVCGGDSVCP